MSVNECLNCNRQSLNLRSNVVDDVSTPNQNNVFHSTANSFDSRDPASRIANAIEQTLIAVRNSSNVNSSLLNRLKSIKKLPTYSGDPLDWMRFKQAFDLSTELGNFGDRENTVRLFEALVGNAREATKTLFAAGNGAQNIMKTLEMRFGNTKTILEKVVIEIKNLPSINSGKIDLVEFASKIKNAVEAIKSMNQSTSYLYSPELAKGIFEKIPSSMMYNYVRYASEAGQGKSDLEKLAEFLFKEAQMAIDAGVINMHFNDTSCTLPAKSNRSYQKNLQ